MTIYFKIGEGFATKNILPEGLFFRRKKVGDTLAIDNLRQRLRMMTFFIVALLMLVMVGSSYFSMRLRMAENLATQGQIVLLGLQDSATLKASLATGEDQDAQTLIDSFVEHNGLVSEITVFDKQGQLRWTSRAKSAPSRDTRLRPEDFASDLATKLRPIFKAQLMGVLPTRTVPVPGSPPSPLRPPTAPELPPEQHAKVQQHASAPVLLGQVFVSMNGEQFLLKRMIPSFIMGLVLPLAVLLVVTLITRRVYGILMGLRSFADNLASGNFSAELDVTGKTELGDLARALMRTAYKNSAFFRRVRAVLDELDLVAEQISSRAGDLASGAELQFKATKNAGVDLGSMGNDLRSVASTIQSINELSQKSSTEAEVIAQRNRAIGQKTLILSQAAESLSTSVSQVGGNVANMATQVDVLRQASSDTEDAILRTNQAVRRVREMSNETSSISGEVSRQATQGSAQIQNSMAAMQVLVDAMAQVRNATGALTNQVDRVVNLLDAISAVAKRTNLLSLNAAIIASQAGEHGHQFQVVAREVKDLAGQSASLTHDIESVLGEIGASGRKTSLAVDRASASVNQGLDLVQSTGDGLQSILNATHQAAAMSEDIAQAMAAREDDLEKVRGAMGKVLGVTSALQRAAQGQLAAIDAMRGIATSLSGVSEQFQSDALQQINESEQIGQMLTGIADRVQDLLRVQNTQINGSDRVTQAMDALRQQAQSNRDAATLLEEVSAVLVIQATELRSESQPFVLRDADANVNEPVGDE